MVHKLHCAFFLATVPVILGLKLQVNGKMDFGPKWNYEYRIKPLETETDDPSNTYTSKDIKPMFARHNNQPKIVDIVIRNNKSNPRLIQVAEAHIYDRKDDTEKDGVTNLNQNTFEDFEKHAKIKQQRDKASRNHEDYSTIKDQDFKKHAKIKQHRDKTSRDLEKYSTIKDHDFEKHAKIKQYRDKSLRNHEDYSTIKDQDFAKHAKIKQHRDKASRYHVKYSTIKDQDFEQHAKINQHKASRNHEKYSTIKVQTTTDFKFSDEHTTRFLNEHKDVDDNPEEDKLMKRGRYVQHLVRFAGAVDEPKPLELEEITKYPDSEEQGTRKKATLMMSGLKKKNKHKHRSVKKEKTTEIAINTDEPLVGSQTITTKMNVDRFSNPWFPWLIANDLTTEQNRNMYIQPWQVRDDPKIKDFMRHLYDQSMKTLDEMKNKIDNFEMKKEVDHLKRSYEDKFSEFIKETQNYNIKTRLGSKKVILNTLDTSNKIMDRLLNYMIWKLDKNNVLRNAGVDNEIVQDLKQKKELENQHLCIKMQICPTNNSYTEYVIDILNSVLRSPDNKIIQFRDAWTEVLKNTDFSKLLEPATEKNLLQCISDLEKYNIVTVRPIFSIMKNILSSKNSPIKVVGPEDNRVNKTIAFLEMLDNWDKKMPPNEKNVLDWNDMRNSFEEWRAGKRLDTVDLVQRFTDQVVEVMSKEDAMLLNRHINTILGY